MNRPVRRQPWCYPLPCDYCGQYGCECFGQEVVEEVTQSVGGYVDVPTSCDDLRPPERGVDEMEHGS